MGGNHIIQFGATAGMLTGFLIFPLFSGAQVWEEWIATYGNPPGGLDEAKSLAVGDSGSVFVTGMSAVGSGWPYDAAFTTIRYNPTGQTLWIQNYNNLGTGTDRAVCVQLDSGGNVLVTGDSEGAGTEFDIATIKYGPDGTQIWVERFDGPSNWDDEPRDLAVDGQGNIYVTGYSYQIGNGWDYITIKYNAQGAEQWVARFNGPDAGSDDARCIAVDSNGNVYVSGGSERYGAATDYATIKYDSSGAEQWIAWYGYWPTHGDGACDLALDGSGNVCVTGYSASPSTGSDFLTIKYTADGEELWVARFDTTPGTYEQAYDLALDTQGNIYVTGGTWRDSAGGDFITLKYNAEGQEQWVAFYDGLGHGQDYAQAVAVDNEGNAYVTGLSDGLAGSPIRCDFATVKYNTDGQEQWVIRRPGSQWGGDGGADICVDPDSFVYVTGTNYSNYMTIKYGQNGSGVKIEPAGAIPQQRALHPIFPNPFNLSATIHYDLPIPGWVTLEVFDLAGRPIGLPLQDGWQQAGAYYTTFSGWGLPSGIYLCRATMGNHQAVQKVALLK